MTHRHEGPQRSDSVNAYLIGTRILAAIAALALAAGLLSDSLDRTLWQRHAWLAGLTSSIVVVMLSAGVFNEAVERRRRRRWSVLAQYVMLDLVRNARLIWTSILEQSRLLPSDLSGSSVADVGAPIVSDRDRLTPALATLIRDPTRRQALHDEIAASVHYSDQLLGRWAAVMLNADLYAEVIDRHVELATRVAWLSSLLDSSNPPDDHQRGRLARVSAAVQIEGAITDEMLVSRLISIAQLAEELDRGTLKLALRLVPIDWWQARMGTAAPSHLAAQADS